MKDTLTEKVARLHRAGSKHSRQTDKLRKAVNNLLEWMRVNLPADYILPFNCRLYPSGEFVYQVCGQGTVREDFKLIKDGHHSISDLNLFSILIADGFIDKIIDDMERESSAFSATTLKLKNSVK
jgi:hypothetical protein